MTTTMMILAVIVIIFIMNIPTFGNFVFLLVCFPL